MSRLNLRSESPDSSLTRRQFLGTTGLAGLGLGLTPALATGPAVTVAAAFDRAVQEFMEARDVPGGALAVVKDRRLVHARGYGWADRERQIPVKPDSLFRIASVTKPITGVAVMKLVEQGRLRLEARPFELLDLKSRVPAGKTLDDRWHRITVRELLQHSGGWDRNKSFDPMFRAVEIARELGVPRPAKPWDVIRYMLGQPLDFDPGQRESYSNFGYLLLGRVIEAVTGTDYEPHVRRRILSPIGIRRMRVGASLDRRQAEGEVRYYAPANELAENVFPDPPEKVPWPYGGFHLEAMDAHGAWIASAVDLARFAAALDDPRHSRVLRPETLATMYQPPPPPAARDAEGALNKSYYGCGWSVRPQADGRANYWHGGSLPGTSTLLVRRGDGVSYAVLFNQRSSDAKKPDGAIDPLLYRAADSVTEWPRENLFRKF